MPVRKTESRIPANFQASDLGQAVVAADRSCALISFLTSPTVVNRENVYVLAVTDTALATMVYWLASRLYRRVDIQYWELYPCLTL